MKKGIILYGTRPELIKILPLYFELLKESKLSINLIDSRQHTTLNDDILNEFAVKPDFYLPEMNNHTSLASRLSDILDSFDSFVNGHHIDFIIVHGDTLTTLAGALVASLRRIKLFHLEAGLRTHNKLQPYPEEIIRKTLAQLADFHFAPTETSYNNLIKEGISNESVFLTGNTIVDVVQLTNKKKHNSKLLNELIEWVGSKDLIVVTMHRRENIDNQISELMKSLVDLLNLDKDVCILFISHPNPEVKKVVKNLIPKSKYFKLIQPMGLIDFHNLLRQCKLIITDSGGIQEEATIIGKNILVNRNVTERIEAIDSNTGLKLLDPLAKIKTEQILNELKKIRQGHTLKSNPNIFGSIGASKRIKGQILEILNINEK